MSAKVLFQYNAVLCVLIGVFCQFVMGTIVQPENYPQSNVYNWEKPYGVYQRSAETTTTECIRAPQNGNGNGTPSGSENGPANSQNVNPPSKSGSSDSTSKSGEPISQENSPTASVSASKLYELVQHIYAAQARVQLEVNEIKKAEAVANSAQKSLEEAANNVRVITSALQAAQQEVATAAVRAQTAQMQLAAHDQLLFAARQKVDALSAQMVGLQAEDGVGAPKNAINIQALLSQLKEPLSKNQTPTAIPPIDNALNEKGENTGGGGAKAYGFLDYDEPYRVLFN